MGIQNFDHSHHKLKIRGQQSPVDVLTFEGRELRIFMKGDHSITSIEIG
ncbi:hypothetical protein [Escherichia coli]|nr:hypothetical protein [Escherichia coli]MDC7076529.1 hypothetical protein [Escherichia coli]